MNANTPLIVTPQKEIEERNKSRFKVRALVSPIMGLLISGVILFIVLLKVKLLPGLWFIFILFAPTITICIILSNIGPLKPIQADSFKKQDLIVDSSLIWSILVEIVLLAMIFPLIYVLIK